MLESLVDLNKEGINRGLENVQCSGDSQLGDEKPGVGQEGTRRHETERGNKNVGYSGAS